MEEKSLFIAEKPSVAQEFIKALKEQGSKRDGYWESASYVVTWCVGHLVTMSYPEVYDPALKKWTLAALPFLPEEFKYEVIPSVQKQFNIVSGLLNRKEVATIYVCTDSGREGEYIYRLVEQMAGVKGKKRKRVWIDSQTEEEILRGIREAKDLSEYDNLSAAAYLRAKEDYLMGINFSRLLTLKYGWDISNFLKRERNTVISVGRVMTCVLGMIVRREREIRAFVKTPFYRVLADIEKTQAHQSEINNLEINNASINGKELKNTAISSTEINSTAISSAEKKAMVQFSGEWRVTESSRYYKTPVLYKENGFKKGESAKELIGSLEENPPLLVTIEKIERKKEKKNPPLLFNLAELQNECSKLFKISPDETLRVVQELYEKKLVTYPRTDARVLSSAVAKEILKNIKGLRNLDFAAEFVDEIISKESYKGLTKTRYVNDKQITDHYAIIPTGQGMGALGSLSSIAGKVYQVIVRRFLSIFFPSAQYQKLTIQVSRPIDNGAHKESFFSSFKVLAEEGYLKVVQVGRKQIGGKEEESSKNIVREENKNNQENQELGENSSDFDTKCDLNFLETLKNLKKGDTLSIKKLSIKEGETTPPKRYNSGSLILAMENAGQLIEDEELRAQIKGSGIGTSATRAEILNKLVKIEYICLNKKTQVITPSQLGEMIFDVVNSSIQSLLNPELTASWEKGLTYVAEGTITQKEYMDKLEGFVTRRTNAVTGLKNQYQLRNIFQQVAINYKK